MSRQIDTDICIIGAGPSGMILAHILHQHGIPHVVIDKYSRERIFARGRAGLIDCTVVDILEHYGLASGLHKHGVAHGSCEFRTPAESFVLDYSRYCNGDLHYVWPQDELVDDLMDQYLALEGTKIHFETEALDIKNPESGEAVVTCELKETAEQKLKINCKYIAGCDGYFGKARASIPDEAVKVHLKYYPYNWLAILAHAAPSTDKILYALHPRGFAGHMLRTDKISRYYLQTDPADTVDDWSDEKIWEELRTRFSREGWTLIEGGIFQKGILEMRSYVIEPMSYNKLYLAGDSAHTITPCGAKGLNLAIHDAEELARCFIKALRHNDPGAMDEYSKIRLPKIWQHEEFSHTMLETIHKLSPDGEDDPFTMRIKESRIAQLMSHPTSAMDFSRKYVGERLPKREPL